MASTACRGHSQDSTQCTCLERSTSCAERCSGLYRKKMALPLLNCISKMLHSDETTSFLAQELLIAAQQSEVTSEYITNIVLVYCAWWVYDATATLRQCRHNLPSFGHCFSCTMHAVQVQSMYANVAGKLHIMVATCPLQSFGAAIPFERVQWESKALQLDTWFAHLLPSATNWIALALHHNESKLLACRLLINPYCVFRSYSIIIKFQLVYTCFIDLSYCYESWFVRLANLFKNSKYWATQLYDTVHCTRYVQQDTVVPCRSTHLYACSAHWATRLLVTSVCARHSYMQQLMLLLCISFNVACALKLCWKCPLRDACHITQLKLKHFYYKALASL